MPPLPVGALAMVLTAVQQPSRSDYVSQNIRQTENCMNRRYLFLSGFALALCTAAASGIHSGQPKDNAPTVRAEPSLIRASQCGPGSYPTSDTLCAEWKSADAAAEAANWAWWQMLIAGSGLAVGTATLIAAGAAACFARDAARHTETGANQARRGADIAANATRAWVVCEKIVLDGPIVFSTVPGLGDRYQMSGKVVIRNNGAALAKSVMTQVDIAVNGAELGEMWVGHPEKSMARYEAHKTHWPLGVTLAPNTEVPLNFGWGGPMPGGPTLEEARHGTFYFIGYIRYRDHHDRDCYTRFAFRPDGDSVKPWDGIQVVPAGAFGEAT